MDALDILRITDVQTWLDTGEQMLNVYWYRVSDIVAGTSLLDVGAAIALEFESVVIDPVRTQQTSGITHNSLQMTSYGNLAEDYVYNYNPPVAGGKAGFIDTAQLALSFKLVRKFKFTRNGSKRIGGIADSVITDARGLNLVGTPGIVAIQDAFKSTLSISIPGGPLFALEPVIVHRVGSSIQIVPANPIVDCIFRGIGTQNSRKSLL